MLLAAIALVAIETYELWHRGPWELPAPNKAKGPVVSEEPNNAPPQPLLASTKNVIDKNLFDPERGAGKTKEAEANAVATQRLRSMILMGTAVLGSSRYAIFQQPPDPRLPPQKGQPGQSFMRLKLGDTIEGFKLSEIRERSVVFTKGTTQVEISLDYFRKADEGLPRAPGPTSPVLPPGRRLPAQQNPPGR